MQFIQDGNGALINLKAIKVISYRWYPESSKLTIYYTFIHQKNDALLLVLREFHDKTEGMNYYKELVEKLTK